MSDCTNLSDASREAILAHDRLCHAATPDEVDSIVAVVLAAYGIELAGATYGVAATAVKRYLEDGTGSWFRRPVDSAERLALEALHACLIDAAVVRYELDVERQHEAYEHSTQVAGRRVAERLGREGGDTDTRAPAVGV